VTNPSADIASLPIGLPATFSYESTALSSSSPSGLPIWIEHVLYFTGGLIADQAGICPALLMGRLVLRGAV
jgi:hypothetical protein